MAIPRSMFIPAPTIDKAKVNQAVSDLLQASIKEFDPSSVGKDKTVLLAMLDGSISIEVLQKINLQPSSWRKAYYDAFVEVVASNLSDRALYNLTHQLVGVEAEANPDDSVFRNSSLAKTFLKYELLKHRKENPECEVPATFLNHMKEAQKTSRPDVSFLFNTLCSTGKELLDIQTMLEAGQSSYTFSNDIDFKKLLGETFQEINLISLSNSMPDQGIEKIVNFYRDININEITNSVPEEILTFFANKFYTKNSIKTKIEPDQSFIRSDAEVSTKPGFALDDISPSTRSSVALFKRIDSTIDKLKNTLDQMKENRHRR